ncbi:hypothetical protein R1sor_015335 [Riccia sorocarpa]|uniref:Reverse transcriptase domain-containing protein n=1 Tax=Riccia sorocarpa TaxID=122646 RepID=A0ABD3HDS1_9MARC
MDAKEISKRLALARLQVQANDSTSNRREFEEALMAARRREQADMLICRVKCRIKWLADGDAPSKYFFACLKAKTKREELTSIKLDSGEVLVDEDRILQLIEDTYGNLYTAEEEGSEALEKRREILQLVDKRLTAAQNRKLEDTPTEEPIEEIVKTLPQEKSPGFDGVTSEVLVEGWDFMRGDCFKMVRKIMFVKLDFQKAYDKVSHSYLWDTLSALGMSADNVRRIQGLVTGGAAQVHVNGRFTRRFEVTRGVRQGCPVAPLLFAMVTQPLMRLLREEEARGKLMGVNYGGQTTLLHQIYADDTGVNLTMEESQFNRLKATIQVFEEISGARLNLAKSLIMHISPGIIPDWVRTTGCDIAGPGKSFLYLGVTTCNPIDEAVIVKAIMQKMLKRLAHWSNRFLSWPAKIILLKQVLAATPLYQLLSVGLEQKGLEALESLCRQFLWGWVDQDHPRASMVAWERITQHKKDGGLGWTPLMIKARALQIRNVVKIMMGLMAEWAILARSLILRTLRTGSNQRERRQWSVSEAFLLAAITKVQGSRTLTRMLTGWNQVRKKIRWDDRCRLIPGHLTLDQGIQLKHWGDRAQISRMQQITGMLRRAGISTLEEGAEATVNYGSWRTVLSRAGVFPEERDLRKVEDLEGWVRGKAFAHMELHEAEGWVWAKDMSKIRWERTTREWVTTLSNRSEFSTYLNNKWNTQHSTQQWTERWNRLWSAPIHHRKKAWIWRFVQRGYFTSIKGKGWTEEQKNCQRCGNAEETLEHSFWYCSRLACRIGEWKRYGLIPMDVDTLIEWLDFALAQAKADSSYLWTFGHYIVSTWTDRNELKFRGRRTSRPLISILRQIRLDIEAYPKSNTSDRAYEITRTARNRVNEWLLTWSPQRWRDVTQRDADYLSSASQLAESTFTATETGIDTNIANSADLGPTQPLETQEESVGS